MYKSFRHSEKCIKLSVSFLMTVHVGAAGNIYAIEC